MRSMTRSVASSIFGTFDMIDSPQPPSGMTPDEALNYAIGLHVRTFANMETIVATHLAYILKLDQKLAFFILKDMMVSQKIKLVMRAADQKFGEAIAAPYRAVLNKIIKRPLEFRNTLVHGAFISTWAEKSLQGKLGRSLTDLTDGMEPMDYATVQRESRLLDDLAAELIAALPDDPKPSS
jgi:hypothetical protein